MGACQVISIVSLECPVCGAPFAPGADRCAYCGSILVLQTDHPRIDPKALNRAVVSERIAEFRDTLKREPGNVTAHYGLGVAYYNLGLTEAAIRELDHACRLTPENPHIHTQLAVAYREELRSGEPTARGEMEDHIQYALRLDPDNVEAMLLQAELDLEREHHAKAIGHLERAYALEPDRAREKLRDALMRSIRWRERNGHATAERWARIEAIDPEFALRERGQAGVPLGLVAPVLDPATRAGLEQKVSQGGKRLKGALKGFFVGLGIGFVVIIVLAMLSTAVERDSGPYNVILVVFILSFLLPVVLAVRGWYVAKR
jgi:tetratricopeptide (TPR) repeat protein